MKKSDLEVIKEVEAPKAPKAPEPPAHMDDLIVTQRTMLAGAPFDLITRGGEPVARIIGTGDLTRDYVRDLATAERLKEIWNLCHGLTIDEITARLKGDA